MSYSVLLCFLLVGLGYFLFNILSPTVLPSAPSLSTRQFPLQPYSCRTSPTTVLCTSSPRLFSCGPVGLSMCSGSTLTSFLCSQLEIPPRRWLVLEPLPSLQPSFAERLLAPRHLATCATLFALLFRFCSPLIPSLSQRLLGTLQASTLHDVMPQFGGFHSPYLCESYTVLLQIRLGTMCN